MITAPWARACVAAGLVLAVTGPAAAHPHVWVDATATLSFDPSRRLNAIETRWVFDEMYAAFAVDGLDTNRDGTLSAQELRPLADENVKQLKEWGYFTVVKAGNLRVPIGPVTAYGMAYADGKLSLTMTLPLATPIDPRQAPVRVSAFDPTFYVMVTAAETATVGMRNPPPGCAAELERPAENEEASVPDAVAMATTVDPADPEASIGAEYAEWIILSCTGR